MRRFLLSLVILAILVSLSIVISPLNVRAIVPSRIYTVDADFEEGTLVGVEHETVHNQLQLSKKNVTLPFIWVPNSNEGTVSKYDTKTGKELGRYRTGPDNNGNPSRTTVDQNGSVWFGNRNTGTVVKIGLYEAGEWEDRNHDGICQTSRDLNNDGQITGTEVLPWGKDECMLFEVLLGSPQSGPRGIAIDAHGDLWAGTYSLPGGNKFYHIDGDTGTIMDTISIAGYQSYGAVIDAHGYLWSSCLSNYVLKIDPVTKNITKVDLTITSYGLGIDSNDHLFVAAWGQGNMAKIDVNTATVLKYAWQGAGDTRGVAVTSDGDVWAVNSSSTQVTRLDNDLNIKATIDIGTWGVSTGAAVDAEGKVWACNYDDGGLHRIDPATNAIDLSVYTVGMDGTGVGQHYSYSDMTGIISRNITTKMGTWTVVFDSEEDNTPWGTLSWSSEEPEGTSVTVKVRSSNDQSSWSDWETATNGVALSATPDGRYLQIEAKLQITAGDVSPILYDLTVKVGNQPPDCSKASADQECLWPPNNQMVPVSILGVTDPDGDPLSITITSITSDEPTASDKGSGGAKHAPDASGVGTGTAMIRSERSGNGDGRVYVINFTANDGKGGECTGSVMVKVPHDQSSKECTAIDSGQKYDATQIN